MKLILFILLISAVSAAELVVDCASSEDARQIKTVNEMIARRLDLLLEKDILSEEALKNESAIIKGSVDSSIKKQNAKLTQQYEAINFRITSEKWLLVALVFLSVSVNIWFWYLLQGNSIYKAQSKVNRDLLKRRQEIKDKLEAGLKAKLEGGESVSASKK